MKLKSVRIFNFRSIRDSEEFSIDEITCLVGKNEAGKTAILHAINKINPINEMESLFNTEMDYPRSELGNYLELESKKPAITVTAKYLLEEDDYFDLQKDFDSDILESDEIEISKGYDNKIIPSLSINESALIKYLSNKCSLTYTVNDSIKDVESLNEMLEILKHQDNTESIVEEINKIINPSIENYIFENYLISKLPKFFYFDEYYQMEGKVNLPELRKRMSEGKLKDSDHAILGLFKLGNLKYEELDRLNKTESLISRLETASNLLSSKALKYWSQNQNIEMKFDLQPGRSDDDDGYKTGENLLSRVYNKKHKVSTPIETRSRGFIWFFSFLAWFSSIDKNEPIILLLDEPALFLHAKAQADMLNYIEKELKPKHQVIYTTHSPFMVDPTKFNRTRIVEDKSIETDKNLPPDKEGTKVITNVLESSSQDSIFPLQSALGYEISQTLFVAPNCLVVEGVSDLLYLQTISGELENIGKMGLDPRWVITPVGGSSKIPTFIALLGAQKDINIVTLLDIKHEDEQNIEFLYKKKLLSKSHVLTYGEFFGSDSADIEDMFEIDFYLELINKEYEKELEKQVLLTDLFDNSPRIVERINKYFLLNYSSVHFSHYRPARYLSENIGSMKIDIQESTFEKFENIFTTINKLVK